MDAIIDLDFRRHLQDLCETWQGKVLRETQDKGKLGAIVLSVLAHSFDEALPILLQAVFPGFYSVSTPFICSAAKIDKAGRIVADVVLRDNQAPIKDYVLFRNLQEMQTIFRRLADHLALDDADRQQLFAAAKNWVVADRRLDPTMNPADPDARRLTVH